MLRASLNVPWLIAPSPMKTKVTPPVFLYHWANASPAPSGSCPPTMPCPPMLWAAASNRCIDPPLPLEQPVALPNISAMATRGSMPSRQAGTPWQR